jgi:beta-glucosidase 2, glycosyl-hydrolase family 116 N-term
MLASSGNICFKFPMVLFFQDSCLPGAVFVWDINNSGKEDLDISITFTFKNGTGGKDDKKGKEKIFCEHPWRNYFMTANSANIKCVNLNDYFVDNDDIQV